MELISAKLHTSIGSFPSSSDLTGFLTSDENVSPIKTYPVYITTNLDESEIIQDKDGKKINENDIKHVINNTLIILNEEYEIMHKIVIEYEIKHVEKLRTTGSATQQAFNSLGIMRTMCICERKTGNEVYG